MTESTTSTFRVERNAASAEFFDQAAKGRLVVRECPQCGRVYPPHQKRCTDSDRLVWRPVSGAGVLISWAVEHSPALSPELAGRNGGPPVIGIVELNEGPWMYAALPGMASEDLREGLRMQVSFLRIGGAEPVPVFTPTDFDISEVAQ